MWRDARGTLRFASVVTRDVSEHDCFVECEVPAVIPLYRLVHFQVERSARDCADLPEVLHSQLETASRDDWRYSEDQRHREGHGDREANSQSSIVNRQFEEAF